MVSKIYFDLDGVLADLITEERDYLGKEDLVTLGELHSSEAEYYMLDD